MYLALIVAALAEGIARPIDKLNYNKTPLRPHQLIFLLFAVQSVFTGLYFWWAGLTLPWPSVALVIVPLCLVPIFSFLKNHFDLLGLHQSDLHLREPIRNFIPVLTVFMAFVLFPSEREVKYLVAALFGSAALLYAKYDPKIKNFSFDKGVKLFLLGALFEAGSKILFKISVTEVTPEVVLLFRSVGTLGLSLLVAPRSVLGIAPLSVGLAIFSGAIYTVGNIAMYYSIKYIGLSETVIFLFLGPVLMYASSAILLKEEICARHVIASLLIVSIVVVMQFV